MKPFEKTINPYRVPVVTHYAATPGRKDSTGLARVFVSIKYDDEGRLSIAGVEGPKRNGGAWGSCGQICLDESGLGHLSPGWTPEMVRRLWEIWGEWHLNDLRPYSPEMKAAGWHEKAKTPAWVWDFSRSTETHNTCRQFQENATAGALCRGVYEATPDEIAALAVPLAGAKIVTLTPDEPPAPRGMKRAKAWGAPMGDGCRSKPPEKTTLGWICPGEWTPGDLNAKHPDGLLGRKLHPEDSHGYGQKWWFEIVPEGVLEWLSDLPEAQTTPAWV